MRPRLFLLVLSLLSVSTVALEAQEGSVGGVVLAEGSRAPLADAEVLVVGTDQRTTTDAAGRFMLTGISLAEVTLQIRRVGYRPVTLAAQPGQTDLRILLAEKVVDLDAVVVSGTAEGSSRRELGNAVSTIDAGQIREYGTTRSLQELLNARAPSVNVLPASGNVGTGSRVRVRGASSLSLSNQPLLYVDGVRVNNAVATGPTNQAFGSASISRLNDINPEDIESIEILKGPAAATLYGTEASNGVIQIITKRPAAGAARWNLTVRQGTNFFANPEGRLWTNYQIDTLSTSPTYLDTVYFNPVEHESAVNRPIWRNGALREYDLSVAGGTAQSRYYLAGGYELSEGADLSNVLSRYSTRANGTVAPNANLSVGLNLGYVTGRTTLPCEAGCGGRVWTTVLADPRSLTGLNAKRRGFHSGTPEEYDLLTQFWQDLDRFTTSVQVRHQPVPFARHRLTFGIDRTREEDVSFTPRVNSLIGDPVWGTGPLGGVTVNNRDILLGTLDYSASADFSLSPRLRSVVSVGGQYYDKRTEFVFASGSVFPAPGLTAVSATTQNRLNGQDFEEEKSLGFFVQDQMQWQDRLYVTAGLRSDDHSAFGRNFDRTYYPKVSASWVLSEEPFFRVAPVDELRLRAAYGGAGLQPTTYTALRTYAPVTGGGDSASVSPQFLGNPNLGPERATELELGLDATALGGRVGVEFTYYRKRIRDAILNRETAPSVGSPGIQPFNAGIVLNQGIELMVRGRPYERGPVSVEFTFGLSTNANKILDLFTDVADPNEFASVGTFIRHQVGYPVGSWFEQRVVSAQDSAGVAINVMCDSLGISVMPCRGADGAFGTLDDAPDVFLGRTLPNVEGSFSTNLTLHSRLRFYALIDFKFGYKKLDGNMRVRCAFFGGRCRENFYPSEFAPERIAGIQSNNNLVDWIIDDAGFAKLREVAVSYTLPDAWARAVRASRATVTLSGRNLHTWTGYGGLEPEAMFLGGSRGGEFSAWEQTVLPQLSSWILTFNLNF